MQMFYKKCRVEHVPVGVVGTIVPWNYPFHNIFNPLLAALFAGNGIVIKVSEHASWSARFYQALVDAALAAAGAPNGLVHILTGAHASCWCSICSLVCPHACSMTTRHMRSQQRRRGRRQRGGSMQAERTQAGRSCAGTQTR
jgi:acyl-CoA reductase-like NAD-dependent aldehyde dehydrogenase